MEPRKLPRDKPVHLRREQHARILACCTKRGLKLYAFVDQAIERELNRLETKADNV